MVIKSIASVPVQSGAAGYTFFFLLIDDIIA